ncbi:histidine phosphatase family protein [Methylomonas sp. MgM2]
MLSASYTKTTIDFLRHGETQTGDYFRGSSDDPLTEQGWRQMFQQCLGQQWPVVIASPLRRCLSFASAWGQERQAELIIDPDWQEIDFGDWEGMSAEQVERLQPGALTNYYADPISFTPPNAESYTNFERRIRKAWESLLLNHAGQNILVVTHAGAIRLLFSTLLNIPLQQSFQIEIPYGCLTRFSCFDDARGRFVQLNFHRPV